jgi:hypothetical protein
MVKGKQIHNEIELNSSNSLPLKRLGAIFETPCIKKKSLIWTYQPNESFNSVFAL